jgi:histidine triad (HIT) family protein
MECPFCNFEHLKNNTRVIDESENILVILSNPRLVPGHVLVIPKKHIVKLCELSDAEKKELFDKTIEYQEKILKFAKGCDIRQHFRPFQAQDSLKVDHLHIHLLPREFEDELYNKCQIFEKKVFSELSESEKEKFSQLLS